MSNKLENKLEKIRQRKKAVNEWVEKSRENAARNKERRREEAPKKVVVADKKPESEIVLWSIIAEKLFRWFTVFYVRFKQRRSLKKSIAKKVHLFDGADIPVKFFEAYADRVMLDSRKHRYRF